MKYTLDEILVDPKLVLSSSLISWQWQWVVTVKIKSFLLFFISLALARLVQVVRSLFDFASPHNGKPTNCLWKKTDSNLTVIYFFEKRKKTPNISIGMTGRPNWNPSPFPPSVFFFLLPWWENSDSTTVPWNWYRTIAIVQAVVEGVTVRAGPSTVVPVIFCCQNKTVMLLLTTNSHCHRHQPVCITELCVSQDYTHGQAREGSNNWLIDS